MPSSCSLPAAEQAVQVGAVVARRVRLALQAGDGALELVDVEASDITLGHLAARGRRGGTRTSCVRWLGGVGVLGCMVVVSSHGCCQGVK